MAAFKHILLAVLALTAAPASAGWITIKNETDHVVLLQEQTKVNGRVVNGKPYRLMPGETLKEFQTKGGERTVAISTLMGAQSTTASYKWDNADAAFAITKGATGYALGAPAEKTVKK